MHVKAEGIRGRRRIRLEWEEKVTAQARGKGNTL